MYTFGARARGLVNDGFDYAVEAAVQRGNRAGDAVEAAAGSFLLGWSAAGIAGRPRIIAEWNASSGDRSPNDGHVETFDQLYPSNHGKYGLADQVGWKNLHQLRLGVEFSPRRALKVNTDVSRLALATTHDAFYASNGAVRVLSPAAPSGLLGVEIDAQVSYIASKRVSVNVGVAALRTGQYLIQAAGGGTLCLPFAQWNVRY